MKKQVTIRLPDEIIDQIKKNYTDLGLKPNVAQFVRICVLEAVAEQIQEGQPKKIAGVTQN